MGNRRNNKEVSSYKWWPGELGIVANMGIVFARMIVKEMDFGVFPFII